MLYLYPERSKLLKVAINYRIKMLKFVDERISNLENVKGIENHISISQFFRINIEPVLKDIIIGKPDSLKRINQKINPIIDIWPELKIAVTYVFNYDRFISQASTRYDAYDLAEALDIRTCPYCNRNYTSTVITRKGEKITRPQFDHYFDKADNPLLALSFYNLIPSCSVCNSSVKGTTKFDLSSHLHPYVDDSIDKIRFTYEYSNQTKSGLEVRIKTNNSSKEKNTVEEFAIEEIYNSHKGELLDLLRTRQYFSDKYLEILKTHLLKGVIVSQEDLYRIAFGTELNPENFINRPFSKFKKDILTELGVV